MSMRGVQTLPKQRTQFQQYLLIKTTVQLPTKLSIIFSILQKIAFYNPNIHEPSTPDYNSYFDTFMHSNNKPNLDKQSNKQFLLAFSQLSTKQKSKYMGQCMKHVAKYLLRSQKQTVPKSANIRDCIKNIQTSCQLYSTILKFPVWVSYNFRFNKENNSVLLTPENKKKKAEHIYIDLFCYLVRKSKKFKNCIVIQGASEQHKYNEAKHTIYFECGVFQEIYYQLFQAVLSTRKIQFQNIINLGKQNQKQVQPYRNVKSQNLSQNNSTSNNKNASKININTNTKIQIKESMENINKNNDNNMMNNKSHIYISSNNPTGMLFLTHKNLQEFQTYKTKIMKFLETNKFQFKKISRNVHKQFRIDQCCKYLKIFRLEGIIKSSASQAKQNFLQNLNNLKNRNKIVISSQVLENYGRYCSVYEKCLFGNKIYELITIKQQNINSNISPHKSQDQSPTSYHSRLRSKSQFMYQSKTNVQNQQVVFIKGVDNIMLTSFLEFLVVKIKQSPITPQFVQIKTQNNINSNSSSKSPSKSPSKSNSPSVSPTKSKPKQNQQSKILILASIKINPDINIDRVKLFLYTLYLNACPSKIKRILSGDTGLDNIQELPATVEVTQQINFKVKNIANRNISKNNRNVNKISSQSIILEPSEDDHINKLKQYQKCEEMDDQVYAHGHSNELRQNQQKIDGEPNQSQFITIHVQKNNHEQQYRQPCMEQQFQDKLQNSLKVATSDKKQQQEIKQRKQPCLQLDIEEQSEKIQQQKNKYIRNSHLNHKHNIEPYPHQHQLNKTNSTQASKQNKKQTSLLLTTTQIAQTTLFKDWNKTSNGKIIAKDLQKVRCQQKQFKEILSLLGNKILRNSNVLDVSLSINMYKKQSHLETIARNLCYAPIFLENVSEKIQRIKWATLFAISVGTLGVSLERPFNPELGQTFQGWIAGCPIYLEQISSYPALSSYYFYGRGFKIYGQIQPKLCFGMNNLKCYSQKINYILFQDGTQLQIIYGKMVIHGLLFGERQFNFQDKIFIYDKKNRLFSQIIYGPRKKTMFSKSPQPWDFCYGKIYQVTSEFRKMYQQFCQTCNKIYPTQKYIVRQISSFQGVWNEAISFNGVQYINFKTTSPCQLQYQKHPLPSNSLYRTDLIEIMSDNQERANKQKQLNEKLQKRDRKLRQTWKQVNNKQIYQN